MNKLDDNSDLLKVLRCAFEVYAELKPGYLEAVYEEALEMVLADAGFTVQRQVGLTITFKDRVLTKKYYADLMVDGHIILELKAVSGLRGEHEQQLRSYLKSTGLTEGMLLNFGHRRRLEWRVITL